MKTDAIKELRTAYREVQALRLRVDKVLNRLEERIMRAECIVDTELIRRRKRRS